MALTSRILLTLSGLFMATVAVLAFLGEQRFGLYYSLFLIEYLVTVLVFAYLEARARRRLVRLVFVLVPGTFLAAVYVTAIQIGFRF